MSPHHALRYVYASAHMLGLALDDARAQRVAAQLQRTAALAQQLEQRVLPPEAEPPEVYVPAPHVLRDLSL